MEKKTIIALYGTQNVGKTQTLLRLIYLLTNEPEFEKRTHDCPNKECAHNEHNIIVNTPGDNEGILEDFINFLRIKEWDIAVTATRTRGSTCEKIREYAKEIGAELVWKKKEKATNNKIDENNFLCSEGLLINIDTIINDSYDGRHREYFIEPNPISDGSYIITHKQAYKGECEGEYEIRAIEDKVYGSEGEAQDVIWNFNSKIVKVKPFNVIFDDDGFYYIHKWNMKEGKYDEKPTYSRGFLSRELAENYAESLGCDSIILPLNIDNQADSQ